jgi:hypothetical protein
LVDGDKLICTPGGKKAMVVALTNPTAKQFGLGKHLKEIYKGTMGPVTPPW